MGKNVVILGEVAISLAFLKICSEIIHVKQQANQKHVVILGLEVATT